MATDIIDIFRPETPASAMGALTIIRNMTGAFLPLAAPSLYAHPDMGWGNSVIVFITIAFIPIPVLSYWKEEWLREKFPVKISRGKAIRCYSCLDSLSRFPDYTCLVASKIDYLS